MMVCNIGFSLPIAAGSKFVPKLFFNVSLSFYAGGFDIGARADPYGEVNAESPEGLVNGRKAS